MLLFVALLIVLLAVLAVVLTGGIGIALIFGDVIAFGLIIYGLFKLFTRKKKAKS